MMKGTGTSQNVHAQSRLHGNKTPLPPIICERDKATLMEVQNYIETELKNSRCTTSDPDSKRFSIYSTAFSMLVSKLTVYRDILSDVKREYEDCIDALRNGEREAKFLQCKVKTMTSIPTTVNGYLRRQKELEERLAILNAENDRLENILQDLVKSQQEDKEEDETEKKQPDTDIPEKVELRPIPGIPVEEWTNEQALRASLDRLDGVLEELQRQRKTSYIPVEKREEALQEFRMKMEERDRLAECCEKMKKRHKVLKMANEAVQEYKDLGMFKTGQSLSDFILKKVTEYSIKRETTGVVDSPHSVFEDDDPSKEKEAELILEYIERFNELFFDREYAEAATHAAISPRGVLRDMETLLRFKEVSLGYDGSPSPLLMFAEAFMYTSPAQNHFADEEISYQCLNCAVNENRPDMVLHWMAQGLIKSSKKAADRLLAYAVAYKAHTESCMTAALKMYAEIDGCKVIAASLLYKLKQPARMLDYAATQKFARETYFELVKECMDGELIWMLSRAAPEQNDGAEDDGHFVETPLPIPLSHLLVFMLGNGYEGKTVAVELLDEIYQGQRSEKPILGEVGVTEASELSKIIYQDGDDPFDNHDLVKHRWKALAAECEEQGEIGLAIDIRAALTVKSTIMNALSVIAEDEKEQFDYYT